MVSLAGFFNGARFPISSTNVLSAETKETRAVVYAIGVLVPELLGFSLVATERTTTFRTLEFAEFKAEFEAEKASVSVQSSALEQFQRSKFVFFSGF